MMSDFSPFYHHRKTNNIPMASSPIGSSSSINEVDTTTKIPTTIMSPKPVGTHRQSRSCHDRVSLSTGTTSAHRNRSATVSCNSKSTKKYDRLLKMKNNSKSCHESRQNTVLPRKGTKKSMSSTTTYQPPKPLGEDIQIDISFSNEQYHDDHCQHNNHKFNLSKSNEDDSDIDDECTFFTHSIGTTSKSEDYEDDEYHDRDVPVFDDDAQKMIVQTSTRTRSRSMSSAASGSSNNRDNEMMRQSPDVKKDIMLNHENTSNNIQVVVRIRPLQSIAPVNDLYHDKYLKVVHHSSEHREDGSCRKTRQEIDDDDEDDRMWDCKNAKVKHASTSTIHIQQPVVHNPTHSNHHSSHRQISCSSSTPTTNTKVHHHQYTFDKVIDTDIFQKDMYHECGASHVVTDCITTGHNATILTYGQTGSGKTYTLLGPSLASSTVRTSSMSKSSASTPPCHHKKIYTPPMAFPSPPLDSTSSGGTNEDTRGIIPRAIETIFQLLEDARNECDSQEGDSDKALFEFNSRVQITLLELYGENLRDLLCEPDAISSPKFSSPRKQHHTQVGHHHQHNTNNLSIRDVTVHIDNSVSGSTNETSSYIDPEVVGATNCVVSTYEEAMALLSNGLQHRSTRCTKMNECSSRSHVIVTISVEQKLMGYCPCTQQFNLLHSFKKSKLNCVDLAGSERQKRTHSSGQSFKEAIGINKGLMALGNVISALTASSESPTKSSSGIKRDEKVFIPYRDSKLTRLLQGCLGGYHKTLMITCISSSVVDLDETIMCLRYANRAKNIQNKDTTIVSSNRLSRQDEQQVAYNNIVLAKKVSDLRKQLQNIASELLQVLDGDVSYPQKYTKDVLRKLLWEQGITSPQEACSFVRNGVVTGSGRADKSLLDESCYDRFDCQSLISSMSSFSSNIIQASLEDGTSLASTTSVTCSETETSAFETLDETAVSQSTVPSNRFDNYGAFPDANVPTVSLQMGMVSRIDNQFTSILELYLTLFSPRLTSISLRTDRRVNTLQSRSALPSSSYHKSKPSLDYFRSLSFTN